MIATREDTRITLEALSYYVPLFQVGEAAEQKLLNGGVNRNGLETQARLKDLALRKIAKLSGPLITSEINKLTSASHLSGAEELFDLLYYAGLAGLAKGLSHFDESKMNVSATNYLFQWFVVYAKRELSIAEAPYGIAPSRFQKYKKISAVRKRLSEQLDRPATNGEVLSYFHDGRADLKTMNGRVGASPISQANRSMSLELVREQEEFEQSYMRTELLDPLEDYSSEVKLSHEDREPFEQSIFGVFMQTYSITAQARAVLLSELGSASIDEQDAQVASRLTHEEYRMLSAAWKELIRDPQGPFYAFLRAVEGQTFSQFDIATALRSIETEGKVSARRRYSVLFKTEGK